jgi:undecaprenyl-diphosphatase
MDWSALDVVAVALARFTSVAEVALALALPLAAGHRGMAALWRAARALLMATGIVWGLQAYVPRPRPYTAGRVRQLVERRPGPSFPSRHVASAFALAVPAWRADRRLGGAMLALAALLGLSRVYSGLHYPSDVLAGAAIGLGCAGLVERSR